MSDTLGTFSVQRRDGTSTPPAGQAIDNDDGWTDKATLTNTARSYPDPDPMPAGGFWYRLKEQTAGGAVIPYPPKLVTPPASAPGEPNFMRLFGGTGTDYGWAVAVDSSGNIYIAGSFTGTINFGGSVGSITAASSADLLILKLNSLGVAQWAKRYGVAGTGGTYAGCIAVDHAGNVVIGGGFYRTINLGGSNHTSFGPGGDKDAFLAKYDSSGNYLWDAVFGAQYPDAISSLAIDASNNIFVTGFIQGTFTLAGTPVFTWGQGIDPFLAKFAPNGTLTYVKTFYSAGTEYGNDLVIDSAGKVFIIGYLDGYINFAGGQADGNLITSPGSYIAKFENDGTHIWSRPYGSPGTRFWRAAVDSSDNITVWADFVGTIDLGGGPMTITGTGKDMFVARFLGANGNYDLATLVGGTGASVGRPTSIAIDNNNNLIIVGYMKGIYSVGNKTITNNVDGIERGFAFKLNSSHACTWANLLKGPALNQFQGVVITPDVDQNKSALLLGWGTGAMTYGAASATSNAGSVDIVLINARP